MTAVRKRTAKVHPSGSLKRQHIPLWKRIELSRDPNFKDLRESLQSTNQDKGAWSFKRGYVLTFKEEAAILKENTRREYTGKVRPAPAPAPAPATATIKEKSKQHIMIRCAVCICKGVYKVISHILRRTFGFHA